jgi:hypothetical protein
MNINAALMKDLLVWQEKVLYKINATNFPKLRPIEKENFRVAKLPKFKKFQ